VADKLKVGVFKFTGCAGCQMELLHLEEELPQIANAVDITYWMMVKRENEWGPWDMAFVEGSVSTPREIKEIKEVRARSKVLVALGDCAVGGCLPTIRNWIPQMEAERKVYEDPSVILSTKIHGLDEYVPVDIYLRGCPPNREMFLDTVKSAMLGVRPALRRHCVCVECKLSENSCLITEKHRPCMGPVTNAGCGALCPSLDRECEGCYGPMSNPNPAALADVLRELGLSDQEVARRFRKYAGTSPEFRGEADKA